MKEAYLYRKTGSGAVDCYLCRHRCRIKEGKTGICAVRINNDGTLYTLVYDKVASVHVDAIEKKPLFHFLPGSTALSFGTVGCNFQCSFCQNAEISQLPRETGEIIGENYTPEKLVGLAIGHECKSIAYTYTEPTIFFELARDTMVEARKHGLYNVFVTNGYMTREMLDDAHGLIDAANVDVKAFNADFYRKYVNARLEGVTDSLRYMKERGIWVEVTTLLIPTLNDNPDEIRALARFIHDEIGAKTPWHLSRFHPHYQQMDLPPTEASALRNARQIGLDEGLRYVYLGNLPTEGAPTNCSACSAVLIDRVGNVIREYRIRDGKCPECGHIVEEVKLG